MRRRTVAFVVVAALTLAGSALAATPLQKSAQLVRSAVPSAEAYYADHGTYLGITTAKLRLSYDQSLRHVVFRNATRRGYCVETTVKPYAHKAGPLGGIRAGRCGVHGAAIPPPASAPADPVPAGRAVAEHRLRNTVADLEAYRSENAEGYLGATIEKLRRAYDPGLLDVTIVWTKRTSYCIETAAGDETYHLLGPAEGPKPGACPAP